MAAVLLLVVGRSVPASVAFVGSLDGIAVGKNVGIAVVGRRVGMPVGMDVGGLVVKIFLFAVGAAVDEGDLLGGSE